MNSRVTLFLRESAIFLSAAAGVLALSLCVDRWLHPAILKLFGLNSGVGEGWLIIIFATGATFWGMVNTFRIYDRMSRKINGIDELLTRVCEEMHRLTKIAENTHRIGRTTDFFYMYVRVPALGSISADSALAQNFKDSLLRLAASSTLDVRLICLTPKQMTNFANELTSDLERTEILNNQVAQILDFIKPLERHNKPLICYKDDMFNSYRVVTSKKWFEFVMKPAGDGTQSLIGREERDPHAIQFAREAFERYWQDNIPPQQSDKSPNPPAEHAD
jgi:hypothetical protein